MARNFNLSEGEYYHIYNRGVDKRTIFHSKSDKERFQHLLFLCNSTKPLAYKGIARGLASGRISSVYQAERDESLTAIGAYCIMGNHFHLLLREIKEGGVSDFIQRLCTAYSMFYNKKYERTGTLFESVYQAKHLNTDPYLQHIFAYIHLNPVRHVEPSWEERGIHEVGEAQRFIEKYPFSSYLDYTTKEREEGKILARSEFPEYFKNKKEFDDYQNMWLNTAAF